jgi:hypothetical protein
MNSLITKLIATAALFAFIDPCSTQAQPHGVRGGDGPQGGDGPGGHGPGGGGHGKGRGDGRPGDFFGPDETLFLNITCDESAGDQAYSCDLPREDEEGMFVCRTRYHPVTGEMNQFPMCIPPDHAMEGDECGCCGGDEEACPKPCGCACELGAGRDGVVREGAYVLFDDADEPVCVPTGHSMHLVATSTEDRTVTCFEECR